MIQNLITLVCVLAGISISAQAAERNADLQNHGLVSINVADSKVEVNASYPGLGNRPDCIVATSDASGDLNRLVDLDKLATLIVVEEGTGILFNEPGRNTHALAPVQQNSKLLYNFADVNTYITGLRIRTANGGSLRQALIQSLRPRARLPHFVGFVRTNDCL